MCVCVFVKKDVEEKQKKSETRFQVFLAWPSVPLWRKEKPRNVVRIPIECWQMLVLALFVSLGKLVHKTIGQFGYSSKFVILTNVWTSMIHRSIVLHFLKCTSAVCMYMYLKWSESNCKRREKKTTIDLCYVLFFLCSTIYRLKKKKNKMYMQWQIDTFRKIGCF